jgi:hypothetical protein
MTANSERLRIEAGLIGYVCWEVFLNSNPLFVFASDLVVDSELSRSFFSAA